MHINAVMRRAYAIRIKNVMIRMKNIIALIHTDTAIRINSTNMMIQIRSTFILVYPGEMGDGKGRGGG